LANARTDIIAKVQPLSIKKARWPSGLRRQLKVNPIRWSERAWVQIPLSSISFCSCSVYRCQSEKMMEWVKNQLFGISHEGFVDDLFLLCLKPGWKEKPWRALCVHNFCACIYARTKVSILCFYYSDAVWVFSNVAAYHILIPSSSFERTKP
jgi:hypothetical protein